MTKERRYSSSENYQQEPQASYSRSYSKRPNSSLVPRQTREEENFEKFDSEHVQSKFEARFGPTGSRWLSVIGSLLGISGRKIKDIKIVCNGEQIKGDYTIAQLMANGSLANKGMRSNRNNRGLYYISHIAAAMPHSPFLFLEALNEDDEKVERVIGFDIPTSLPRSLRYFHAADLPLGPKTRKAHLLWSIHFASSIKSFFDSNIYQRCAQNAEKFRDMSNVMEPLQAIESNIVLNNEEQKVQWPIHH